MSPMNVMPYILRPGSCPYELREEGLVMFYCLLLRRFAAALRPQI